MINVESFSNGIALICNTEGVIVQNINCPDAQVGELACGASILERISKDSFESWHVLCYNPQNTPNITWRLLVVELEGEEYLCLAAAIPQGKILIIGIQGERAFVSLYEEMTGITSQLTNRMRQLYKHIAQSDANLLEEIAHVINELANTKRELHKKNQELEELAIRDPLTGLYNRRFFSIQTPLIIGRALRHKTDICVVSFDINDFKRVNDTLGHSAGDELLQHLAHCLQSEIRQGQDTAYRIGGDEFLVTMEQCNEPLGHRVSERVHQRYLENSLGTTLAYGIISVSADTLGSNLEAAVRLADQRMYQKKSQQKAQR